MRPDLLCRAGRADNAHLRQGALRGWVCRRGRCAPRAPRSPVPCALLHCGADELADQRQELLRVPGMKLLQQREQTQDQRRPVHGVGRFSADHSCKEGQITLREVHAFGGVRSVRMFVGVNMTGAHFTPGRRSSARSGNSGLYFELGPGWTEASSGLKGSIQ